MGLFGALVEIVKAPIAVAIDVADFVVDPFNEDDDEIELEKCIKRIKRELDE